MSITIIAFALPLVLASPEQVHLSFQGNYSVMGVSWITSESGGTTVHYGTTQDNLDFTAKGTEKEWLTGDITRYSHRALMENLHPSTTYCLHIRLNIPWIFTCFHRPFYCSAAHKDDCTDPDNILLRSGNGDLPGLEKPFIQYGIDIGFSGHVHYYERFYPVANLTYYNSKSCYRNAAAPTYIISGSAGCHSSGTKFDKNPLPFSAKRINDYGYTIVSVTNMTHIHLQQISIDQDEAIVDDFWISNAKGF